MEAEGDTSNGSVDRVFVYVGCVPPRRRTVPLAATSANFILRLAKFVCLYNMF